MKSPSLNYTTYNLSLPGRQHVLVQNVVMGLLYIYSSMVDTQQIP